MLAISIDKVLLFGLLMFIWISVLLLEKVMPHQSAAVVALGIMALYGLMVWAANLHQRRKLRKYGPTPVDLTYRPSVSIIIPAHNEEAVIAETVKSLLDLDYPDHDLWVFDDRSTDRTAEVLKALQAEFPGKLNIVIRPEAAMPGKSAVLNEALEKTTGDLLLILDADGRIDADFLTRMVPHLADPDVAAAQARKVILNKDANLLTRCQHHEYLMDAHFQAGRDIIRAAVELRGNGQIVKRAAMVDVGGWTEDTITDDLDLSTKLHLAGWDIRFVTDTVVREEGITRLAPLLRQRRRWAEGSLKRYLEYNRQIITSPDISHRAQLDMIAYLMKFMLPVWVASDLVLQVINFFVGDLPRHLVSSVVMLPATGVFVILGTFFATRHLERANYTPLGAIRAGVETAGFILIVWFPVVMWINAKILVAKDEGTLDWGKTEHLGTQEEVVRRSRLARFKEFLRKA